MEPPTTAPDEKTNVPIIEDDPKRKYKRKIEYKYTEQRKKAMEKALETRRANIKARKLEKKTKIKQSTDEVDENDYEEDGDAFMLENEEEETGYIIKPIKKKTYKQTLKEVVPEKTHEIIQPKTEQKIKKSNTYYIDD